MRPRVLHMPVSMTRQEQIVRQSSSDNTDLLAGQIPAHQPQQVDRLPFMKLFFSKKKRSSNKRRDKNKEPEIEPVIEEEITAVQQLTEGLLFKSTSGEQLVREEKIVPVNKSKEGLGFEEGNGTNKPKLPNKEMGLQKRPSHSLDSFDVQNKMVQPKVPVAPFKEPFATQNTIKPANNEKVNVLYSDIKSPQNETKKFNQKLPCQFLTATSSLTISDEPEAPSAQLSASYIYVPPTQSETGVLKRPLTPLEWAEIMEYEELVGKLLYENRYDEVFALAMRQSEYDPEIQNISTLNTLYNSCLLGNKFYRIPMIKRKIAATISNKTPLIAGEVASMAEELRLKGKYVHSILFFDIAANMFKSEGGKPDYVVDSITLCLYEMTKSVKQILLVDESKKSLVQHHVIPIMRDIKQFVHDYEGVNERQRCLMEVWCLRYIERCEDYAGVDYYQTLREALHLMDTITDRNEYKLYGDIYYSLGKWYNAKSRLVEAESHFIKAIEVYTIAIDWDEQNAQRKLVESCRMLLADIRERKEEKHLEKRESRMSKESKRADSYITSKMSKLTTPSTATSSY